MIALVYIRKYVLFPSHDHIITDPERGHYLMPCVVDENKKTVHIYGCIPMLSLINEDCLGECKVPMLKRTKVAIYLEDITQALTPSRRWSVLYQEIK